MLDLLIINPGAAHGIYGSDLAESLVAVEPPLWCRLIAGYCRGRGHSVQIIDAEAERIGAKEIADRTRELKPKLVCIAAYGHQPSASTQQMVGARAAALAIDQECDEDFKIIMVGGHVSALPEQTLREECIDYVCVGEGPITIEALLRGDPLEKVPGLVYRPDPYCIRINQRAPLIRDLERDLHGDVWDLLPMQLYRSHNWQAFGDLAKRQPYASIYTTLGCVFMCSFCCINAPFGKPAYRMRSPQAVVAEIINLNRRYGVETFKIIDELFVLNPKHYVPICNGLIDAGLGDRLNIWAYARPDTIEPARLDLMRRAGIRWLALGVESASERIRFEADREMDGIEDIVRRVQGAGINVIANYIFGLPEDDAATMRETLDLARRLRTEFANFYSAMAYPGSRLYGEALTNGWTLPSSWAGYSQHNEHCRPLDTRHISAAEVLAFRDAAFDEYFSNPDYLRMIEEKFGAATRRHAEGMTRYKLKRRLLEKEAA